MTWWRGLPIEDRLLWSLGAVALFLGSFIVGHWWGRDDVIFGALQTVFALAAFMAAAAAVKATWPQYRAWRASPVVRVWIEMANSESDVPHPVVGGTAEFGKEGFIVRVVVQNTGEGAMRARAHQCDCATDLRSPAVGPRQDALRVSAPTTERRPAR